MSTPLVVRCGAPGFWVTVWIQNGVGYVLEGGKWQPLTEAPGLGGWVLSASRVAEVVAEYGSPVPTPIAPPPRRCIIDGCADFAPPNYQRCERHFAELLNGARADAAYLHDLTHPKGNHR